MDRDQAPHSAELEQVAEAHLPGAVGTGPGPQAGATGGTTGETPGGSTPTPRAASGRPLGLPEPTVLTWQDLIDLPSQLLPPKTVYHLRNAGREALLAAYSLWRNARKAAAGSSEEKVRKHIEVE